jgi:hypothetical protein
MDLVVYRAQRDPLEPQVLKELRAHKEPQVLLEQPVQPELKV